MADELTRAEIVAVLESGSYTTKLGYADGQSGPTLITRDDWTAQGKSYPIEEGIVQDYDSLGEYWTSLMATGIELVRPLVETPMLFSLPMSMNHRSSIERIAQVIFEALELPACYLAAQPVMSLYACGVVNGLVVDMGHQSTLITPVLDSNIQHASAAILPIGGETVTQALWDAHLSIAESPLRKPFEALFPSGLGDTCRANKMKELLSLKCSSLAAPQKPSALQDSLSLAELPVSNGSSSVALCSTLDLDATAKLSPEAIEAGCEAFKHCMDSLFQPYAGSYNVGDQVFDCLRGLEPDKQQLLLDHVVLTGGCSLLPGAQARLESELRAHFTVSDYPSDSQLKSIRFLRIPDYFPEIKGRNEHAAWFGGSLVAKVVFSDPKNFVSRADYNEHGPKIAWEKPY